MQGVNTTALSRDAAGGFLVHLPIPTAASWSLCSQPPSLLGHGPSIGADVHCPEPAEHPASGTGLVDPPASPEPARWIGAEPEKVPIAGHEYSLSFVSIGNTRDSQGTPCIDPDLSVAEVGAVVHDLPRCLVTYDGFDPATRRAWLEWMDAGRSDANVPTHFPMLFAHFVESAVFTSGQRHLAEAAVVELERLLLVFGKDPDCRCYLQPLVDACRLLDTSIAAPPEFASAITNHLKEMRFAKRLYLGRALQRSRLLEADPALLYLLEQPQTRLDAQVAAAFVVVYHHWTENYAFRFNGGVELRPTKTLSLTYDTLDGEHSFEINSIIPDPASAPVPAELSQFFVECCAEVDQLRGLPVAQQAAIIKGLKSKPQLRGDKPGWSLRPDFEERVSARLTSAGIVLLPLAELISDLFEHDQLEPKKRVPKIACRRMQRALDQIGVGFEPDDRHGLPARLRADGNIALFADETLPFTEPSDPFDLGQAVMVLSALGTMKPFEIKPIPLSDVELRLPNAHRYSERELRRLEATFELIRQIDKPRDLLASWPRSMKRLQRIRHIDMGFGIAFHAQSANPMLKRFATAVSKALHHDDRRVASFLEEVNAQASLDAEPGIAGGALRVSHGDESPNGRQAHVHNHCDGAPTQVPSIPGLSPTVVEILETLVGGPRQRVELNAIARRGQLQLAGALEQLNEWSLATLNARVTRGNNPVRINPDLFDAVELMVRR